MKDKMIKAHMDVATRYSELSTAKKLKVGAIIVKDDRIISIGYNGTPAGWDNTCEYLEVGFSDAVYGESQHIVESELKTKPETIHAEANAIAKLARSNESGKDSVMFITHAPCMECAKLIYGAGIQKVYYKHFYRDAAGREFLRRCNIDSIKLED
jgi:dCMP deaminase